jgi:pimeloyl-ACP methyl ester carboxylesterase
MFMRFQRILLALAGFVFVVGGMAPQVRAAPPSWPTEEGVPVRQWYMKTTDADGTRLRHYVAEYGTEAKPGNTVIVIHGGFGAEHSYLVPAIRPLADRYRFVLYDQRGSLRTPVDTPAKITYSAMIEDLDQLRQRLGLETVTLMAHSMGNHLAYGYLRAHPERVAGLILVGAVPPAEFGDEKPGFLRDVWRDFSKTDADAIAERTANWNREWHDRCTAIAVEEGLIPKDWSVRHPLETDPDLQALYAKTDQQQTDFWRMCFTAVNTYSGRNWRQMPGGEAYYNDAVAGAVIEDPAYQAAIPEFWPVLKAFKGPVRVIIGSYDYVDLGPTYWPRLVTAIPDARLDTIPNAGHSIWMDEPAAFTQSLRTALEETSGPPDCGSGSASERDQMPRHRTCH